MKIFIPVFLAAFVWTIPGFAHDTANGKVAELALHRLERLVILNKIDSSFQTQSVRLQIEKLTQSQPSDPSFKVEIAQGAAPDGTRKTLLLMGDHDGRFTSFSTSGAAAPVSPVAFPQKDATTLLEVSLHCVQGEAVEDSELCATIPELKLLNEKLSSATLTEVRDTSGVLTHAQVELEGTGLNQKAIIELSLDGRLNGPNPVRFEPVL